MNKQVMGLLVVLGLSVVVASCGSSKTSKTSQPTIQDSSASKPNCPDPNDTRCPNLAPTTGLGGLRELPEETNGLKGIPYPESSNGPSEVLPPRVLPGVPPRTLPPLP